MRSSPLIADMSTEMNFNAFDSPSFSLSCGRIKRKKCRFAKEDSAYNTQR